MAMNLTLVSHSLTQLRVTRANEIPLPYFIAQAQGTGVILTLSTLSE